MFQRYTEDMEKIKVFVAKTEVIAEIIKGNLEAHGISASLALTNEAHSEVGYRNGSYDVYVNKNDLEKAQVIVSVYEDNTFKKHFNTVTPTSRLITLFLFVLLPFAGFWMGVEYKNRKHLSEYVDALPQITSEECESQGGSVEINELSEKELSELKNHNLTPVGIVNDNYCPCICVVDSGNTDLSLEQETVQVPESTNNQMENVPSVDRNEEYKIKITKIMSAKTSTGPIVSNTFQQGDSVLVRWETNGMSGKELLLGFVYDDNNSPACDSAQTVDPYLRNGVPISSPEEFGTSMHIGSPGGPGGTCTLEPGQYKVRLCEKDPSDITPIEDTCAYSPTFTVTTR